MAEICKQIELMLIPHQTRKWATPHGCLNHSNLEMEAECLMKNLSYLDFNISRIKNGRSNLYFFSLCDIRNEAVFLILEHSILRGIKQKKNEKKHEILCQCQVSRQASTWSLVFPSQIFYIFSSLLGCYFSEISCTFHFGQMFNGDVTSTFDFY